MASPRLLILDLETSPIVAHVWSLWKQTVSLNQILESTEVISFAAKWLGEEDTAFHSIYDFERKKITQASRKAMVKQAWRLLDEADIVIHYNGKAFDMPNLRREFLRQGMTPPSPVKEVDLLLAVKSTFRFASNKLQYVSQFVGLEGKMGHEGHQLWVDCMAGLLPAWETMRAYNIQDVVQTEHLYKKLLPWIPGHPHIGLYEDEEHACQRCGARDFTRQGFAYTVLGKFQQFRCNNCGSWSRSKKNQFLVDERGVQ